MRCFDLFHFRSRQHCAAARENSVDSAKFLAAFHCSLAHAAFAEALNRPTVKAQFPPIGFEMIFADCSNLVRSAALLRLNLDRTGKSAILAFGVRETDHFHPGQSADLLQFLGDVAAVKLDDTLMRGEFPA